jgi:hypothetical protein
MHKLTPPPLPSAFKNRLLAFLPQQDYEKFRRHLEPMTLQYKRSLYEANGPIDFVYFIETGVASLVVTMANGDAAEVGTIGNESDEASSKPRKGSPERINFVHIDCTSAP